MYGLSGWRWVRPEGIHLTLRFLGEVDAETDTRCRAVWRERIAGHVPFRFRLERLGGFPPRGRPRVLWVGIGAVRPEGALQALAGSLESAARLLGFPAESRPFRAHLTLARVRRAGEARMPEDLQIEVDQDVAADHVALYRSELHSAGARYTALERYALEG